MTFYPFIKLDKIAYRHGVTHDNMQKKLSENSIRDYNMGVIIRNKILRKLEKWLKDFFLGNRFS